MTEPTTTTEQVGGELELVADPTPFLRITGTYPSADGRVETVQLEMHVGDGVEIGDDGEASTGQWLTDFCTCIVAALRGGRHPALVTVNNAVRDPESFTAAVATRTGGA